MVGQDLHKRVSLDSHIAGSLPSEALRQASGLAMAIGSKGEPNNQREKKPRVSHWVTNVPVEEV